ncbi:hypothetical protein DFH09DRAFT_1080953 [Mycena vulgaris]|nr:hypothetical protein DFH09DRAFT_1080953 [Mycena vulgaris]
MHFFHRLNTAFCVFIFLISVFSVSWQDVWDLTFPSLLSYFRPFSASLANHDLLETCGQPPCTNNELAHEQQQKKFKSFIHSRTVKAGKGGEVVATCEGNCIGNTTRLTARGYIFLEHEPYLRLIQWFRQEGQHNCRVCLPQRLEFDPDVLFLDWCSAAARVSYLVLSRAGKSDIKWICRIKNPDTKYLMVIHHNFMIAGVNLVESDKDGGWFHREAYRRNRPLLTCCSLAIRDWKGGNTFLRVGTEEFQTVISSGMTAEEETKSIILASEDTDTLLGEVRHFKKCEGNKIPSMTTLGTNNFTETGIVSDAPLGTASLQTLEQLHGRSMISVQQNGAGW